MGGALCGKIALIQFAAHRFGEWWGELHDSIGKIGKIDPSRQGHWQCGGD